MDQKRIQRAVSKIVRSRKSFNKIFCIGFNKTGTTSLETLLTFYGYRLPNQERQEVELTRQVFAGNYRPLKEFVPQFDAFQDLPFSHGNTYIAADCLFPESKFILTCREPEAWFTSLCSFHSRLFNVADIGSLREEDILQRFNYLYPQYVYDVTRRFLTVTEHGRPRVRWDLLYDRDYYIESYTRRNKDIQNYFVDRGRDFLAIDLTQASDSRELCRFLEIPEEFAVPIPHENRTADLKAPEAEGGQQVASDGRKAKSMVA